MAVDNERGSRAQQEKAQRRRRDDAVIADKRLPIPPEIQAQLDRDGRVPRWANDEGNRIYRLTEQDDYDKVDGVEPVPVGVGPDGKPILAHLLSKPKAFIDEDQAKAEAKRKEVEKVLFHRAEAVDAAAAGANPNPATAERYVTKNSSLGRGNQILE